MTEQELYDHAVSLLAKKNYASGEMHRQLSRLTESTGDIEHVHGAKSRTGAYTISRGIRTLRWAG